MPTYVDYAAYRSQGSPRAQYDMCLQFVAELNKVITASVTAGPMSRDSSTLLELKRDAEMFLDKLERVHGFRSLPDPVLRMRVVKP